MPAEIRGVDNAMTKLPQRSSAFASPLVVAGRIVDVEAGVLRGADGAPVGLRPQAWAVLSMLARRAGSVVTKAELFDAVWPGLAVTDASLTRAVSDVRAAFGAEGHQVIKTAARRGYLLVAPPFFATDGGSPLSLPLPAAHGPLFGRDAELEAVRSLLAGHRLVTLTGAGGIGKTRVAIAAARLHAQEAPRAAAWVDLAQLADPSLLVATIARALGLPVAQGGEQVSGLLAALTPLTVLLVLDNAEHLLASVSRLTRAMLDAAPGLRMLVTSQAPLRIDDEQLFGLAALAVPTPAVSSIAQACGYGAVALFVDQARALDRHFELTPSNLAQVIELCRRLDGLPLAIRLAAARLPLLGLSGVVSRLDERLELLATNKRDASTRQQTLLATLEWSHGLLAPPEQALFKRLGVFVGGFSLDLAIALARCEGIEEWALIERLRVLVERSLVDVDRTDPPRYRLLETQREYAVRLLRGDGTMAYARRDHARAVERVMRSAFDEIWQTTDAQWLPRWAPELDNVRAALDGCAAHDATLFASLVGSSVGLFRLLDLAYELRHRAAAVSPELLATTPPDVAARYWLARTYLEAGVSYQAVHDFAVLAERAARTIPEPSALYIALCHRVASSLLAPRDASGLMAEIVALESDAWGPRLRTCRRLAEWVLHSTCHEWPQALQAAEAGYALETQAGAGLMRGIFANAILVALVSKGDAREAARRAVDLEHVVAAGPAASAIPFLGTSARCSLLAGDLPGARRRLAQLFSMCRVVEWMYFDFFGNVYLRLALMEGRMDDAALLLGFAHAASGRSWSVANVPRSREEAMATLAQAIAQPRLSELLAEGAGLSREAVCELALREGKPLAPRRRLDPNLTARQAEVMRLVGQGKTDKQVARTLGLSPRTVEMHVARVIDALRCSNRAEAVRIVTERRLVN